MGKPHPRTSHHWRIVAILFLAVAVFSDGAMAGSRRRLPSISVTSSSARVSAGNSVQFTVRTSRVDLANNTSVSYSMAGTAVPGQDYVATGGNVVIPAGANAAAVTLNTLNTASAAGKVATLRLLSSANYKVSTPSRSSVTIMPGPTPSPSPTPSSTPSPTPSTTPSPTPSTTPSPTPSTTPSPTSTPTPTPRPTPQQEIWIAARTDGNTGSGTQVDPYDGSTPAKFDKILHDYYWTPDLGVHLLGAGPFQTDVNHSWQVRPGWVISGDGMYTTTVQLVGSVAGWAGVAVFASDPNISTDSVTIRDLTIDCNWPALESTAPDGLNGEKNSGASAVIISGSNNLLERVRSINSYGSWENHKEAFVLFLTGPRNGDGTNNIISQCRAEQPWGTYGNPFALSGWTFSQPWHLITDSKVINCTAVGRQSGQSDGFSSGGANLANVKNCVVDGNTFIDCYGAAYIDVGQLDGLQVTNNTVTRGWVGVGLRCPVLKQNITISGNSFNIQNRFPTNASCGIFMDSGPLYNVIVDHNTMTFDTSGAGLKAFWGIAGWSLNGATISNNTLGVVDCELDNIATGTGVTLLNNVMSDGSPVSFLAK